MPFDREYTLTIDGRAADCARRLPVIDPATGTIFAEAPDAGSEQLDQATRAARRAFPGWRDTPGGERRKVLKRAATLLKENVEPLMRLLTREQGKPLAEARAEILGAAYWLSAMSTIEPPVVNNEDTPDRLSVTRRVPLGVVAAISPWNYPVLLSMWKIAPALAAGNAVVMKPSPYTPLTMLKIGELLREVLPPGILNVLCGGDELGPLMTGHPGFDKVSFTGSTETGRRVMASAAAGLTRLTLELGGNDPAIVLPDVDVEATAQALFWAAFRNTGQVCVATKRLYVHEAIYERFAQVLVRMAERVRIGNGMADGTELGPVQNAAQYTRVVGLIEDARAQGFDFLCGGATDPAKPGYFLPITIVDNPPEDARVVQEEAFGPILPLLRFADIDDVIARANASPYGLAASVWSNDLDAAQEIALRLEAGTVWINEVQHLSPFQPFAGRKQSGLGIENGLEGLLEYTAAQTITIRNVGDRIVQPFQ